MEKNKKLPLILFLLLVVLTLVFVFIGKKTPLSPIEKESFIEKTTNSSQKVEKLGQVLIQAPQEFETLGECRKLTNDINSHRAKKIKELRDKYDEDSDWDEFLVQGYSVEEVAYLIELIKPGLWAEEWVHDKRRSQSLVAQNKHENDKKLLDEISGVLSPKEIESLDAAGVVLKTRPRFPQKNLEKLQDFSKAKQFAIIDSNAITINDLAYFMRQPTVSDEAIGLMIDKLASEKDSVYYDGIRSVNILDYALASARPDIYDLLVSKDYKPSQDAYLNNTLEWGLVGLTRILENRTKPLNQAEKTQLKKLVNIVKSLNKNGFTADFRVVENSFYSQGFAGHWIISKANVDLIQDYYGFSLGTLVQTNQGDIDSHASLKKLYESKILSDYENSINSNGFVDAHQKCSSKLVELQSVRSSLMKSAINEVKRVKELYNNDSVVIENFLKKLDPSLIDAYRASGPITMRRKRNNQSNVIFSSKSLDEKLKKAIYAGNYKEASSHISSSEFYESDHQQLANLLCENSYRYKWFDEFLNAGLKPDNIERCMRDIMKMPSSSLSKLSKIDIDLSQKNQLGKGLLFRAVSNKNLEIVSVLIKENIENVDTFDGSMDSLDNLLSLIAFEYSGSDFLESIDFQMLSLLLSKKPEIDESHLKRISLIKVFHPELYIELSNQFPSLEINENQAGPEYLFTYARFLLKL